MAHFVVFITIIAFLLFLALRPLWKNKRDLGNRIKGKYDYNRAYEQNLKRQKRLNKSFRYARKFKSSYSYKKGSNKPKPKKARKNRSL